MAEKKRTRLRITVEEREQIRQLTLMSNIFMNIVLENNIPCVEEMLRVILKRDDLTVKSVQTQRTLQGFSRSVCLDIYAVDSEGRQYNIEIQQASEGANPRRVRFHGAMMDVHALKAGQDFRELPECYVIFITLEDVLGSGKAMYTVHRYIDGEMRPFEDGSHIIYINASAKEDGTELWRLIHDLRCADPDEMYLPRLAARVRFLKQSEEGTKVMDDIFDKIRKDGESHGRKDVARRMLADGESLEKTAKYSGLSIMELQSLAYQPA